MIDINLINHIMNVVAEPGGDNNLSIWNDNVDLYYGSIIINDEETIFIKAKEIREYKETLVDISMPITCFEKCRYEVRQHLLDVLLSEDK